MPWSALIGKKRALMRCCAGAAHDLGPSATPPRTLKTTKHDLKGSTAMVSEDPLECPSEGALISCSASTTATNCHPWHKSRSFDPLPSVFCDWVTAVHVYPEGVPPRESGRVLKVTSDGQIDWESQCWEAIRCPSSDTSIRAKCDGRSLRVTGNVGRFGRASNVTGYSLGVCVDRARVLLENLGFDVTGFGVAGNHTEFGRTGTVLARVDLAANCLVSDYPMLCHALSVRKIGRVAPIMGKYGPTWGYGAKRGGWVRAKLYDKDAEQAGRRTTSPGATMARFEVQLGREWLRVNGLDTVESWCGLSEGGVDMGQVIWGRFAEEAFMEGADGASFVELPASLQRYAYAWKDGADVRSMVSDRTYYRVRRQLLEYGIDVGVRCNVVALKREVRKVSVEWLTTDHARMQG